MHSPCLEPVPKANSYGYVYSWYNSDGGAERQDWLTFSLLRPMGKQMQCRALRRKAKYEDFSMPSVASPHTLSMTPSSVLCALTHLQLPEGLWS